MAINSVAVVSFIADTLVIDWSLGGTHFRWHARTLRFLVTNARCLTAVSI